MFNLVLDAQIDLEMNKNSYQSGQLCVGVCGCLSEDCSQVTDRHTPELNIKITSLVRGLSLQAE